MKQYDLPKRRKESLFKKMLKKETKRKSKYLYEYWPVAVPVGWHLMH